MYKYIYDCFGVVSLMAIGLVIAVGGFLILQSNVSVSVNSGIAEYVDGGDGDGAGCADGPTSSGYYCGGKNIGDSCEYTSWFFWTISGTCQHDTSAGGQNIPQGKPICICKGSTGEESDGLSLQGGEVYVLTFDPQTKSAA